MATSPAVLLRVYAAAIFLSAALLFAVQPMFTKMVLPKLGGTPAVWSVAMVFFQAVLLAGYAYAHALTKSATANRSANTIPRSGSRTIQFVDGSGIPPSGK